MSDTNKTAPAMTPTNKTEPENTQPAPGRSTSKREPSHRSMAGGLALILALTALVISGFLGYRYYEKRGLFESGLERNVEQLMEDMRAQQEVLERQRQALDTQRQSLDTLQRAMQQGLAKLGGDRRSWVLTETEQLLIIANHRLQLAHDIDSALAALQTADRQLEALADPRLLAVRRAIAREITALNAVERIDTEGMVLSLQALMANLGQWPLQIDLRQSTAGDAKAVAGNKEAKPDDTDNAATENRKAAPEDSPWARMWRDFTGLIRIRTNVEQQKPLLTPEQRYFLQQHLYLALSGAQHALLAGNATVFRQQLTDSREWIKEYFDSDAAAVSAALQSLTTLESAAINVKLPDISQSLAALRTLKNKKD